MDGLREKETTTGPFFPKNKKIRDDSFQLEPTDAAATELWVVPRVVCVYSVYSVSCRVNIGPSWADGCRSSGKVTTAEVGCSAEWSGLDVGIVSSEFDSALVVVSILLLSTALIVACACSWCCSGSRIISLDAFR